MMRKLRCRLGRADTNHPRRTVSRGCRFTHGVLQVGDGRAETLQQQFAGFRERD